VFRRFGEFFWDLQSFSIFGEFSLYLRSFGIFLGSSAFWSFRVIVNFLRVFGILVFRHFGEFSWDLWSSAFLVNFLRVFGILVFQSYSEFSWDLRSSALLENLGFFGLSAF
ncbi:7829_t:CDS:2, partial [Dentiscutata heterogama]